MSMEIVKQEVLDWHQFLHQFFRAEIPAEAFSRMAPVLTEEFQYVAVWGEVGGREAFLSQVPGAYGAFPELDVYVEDLQVRELGPDLYLASFIQVETFPNVPHRRKTSAILRVEDGLAKWILFHLTFIDPQNRPVPADE
jgi:hypothetical protein